MDLSVIIVVQLFCFFVLFVCNGNINLVSNFDFRRIWGSVIIWALNGAMIFVKIKNKNPFV